LIAVALPATTPAQPVASVETVPLPGTLSSLVEAAHLDPDTPRARVMIEVIRQAHAAPPGASPDVDAARARLAAWLGNQSGDGTGDQVPLPLGVPAWRRLAQDAGAAAMDPVRFVLLDRRAALVYVGAMALDADTRAWLAAQPVTLLRLYRELAGEFAAFGRVVRVARNLAVLPGDAAVQAALADVVGEDREAPAAFLVRLLARHAGRLAYFIDTVAHLDPSRRRLALAAGVQDPADRAGRVRALLRLFVEWSPAWRVADRPFTRPLCDAASVVAGVLVTPAGTLAPPTSAPVWDAVFGTSRAPWAEASWQRRTAQARPVDVADLATRVLEGDVRAAHERLGAVLFVQQAASGQTGWPPAVAARVGRAFLEQRALVVTLDRLGVRDPVAFGVVLDVAEGLPETGRAPQARLMAFQAALGLLDRAQRNGAMSPSDARVRLLELAQGFAPDRAAPEGWLGTSWLPSLAGAGADEAVEDRLLARVAGVADTGAGIGTNSVPLLDGESYRACPEEAEHARLVAVRSRQSGNRLDDVLGYMRAVALVEAAVPDGSAVGACDGAVTAAGSLDAIPWPDVGGVERSAPTRLVADACKGVDRRGGGGASGQRSLAALRSVAAVALADTLAAMVYALHVGEPDGAIDLAPDLARRHQFDLDIAGRAGQARGPWALPDEARGGGAAWHVRGSLLVLEHALAGNSLRRLGGSGMPGPPTLPSDEQRTLSLSLALMTPYGLDDAARDQLLRWAAAGSTAVSNGRGNEAALLELADTLGWTGLRRATLAWAASNEPEAVPGLFTAAEEVALGAGGGLASLPDIDRWGAASLPADGRTRLVWPPAEWEKVTGRSPAGLLTSRFVDLTLRAAEALSDAGLPARLLPGVLAAAVSDLIEEARLGHLDDVLALTAWVRRVPAERFDDYAAALVASGALLPVESGAGGSGR
jgi:hypothetical protein